MGADLKEIGVPAELRHLAQDGLSVSRPEPGVDDERRLVADNDADVRHAADVEVRYRVNMFRQLDGFVKR